MVVTNPVTLITEIIAIRVGMVFFAISAPIAVAGAVALDLGASPVHALTLVAAPAMGFMTMTDRQEVNHMIVAVDGRNAPAQRLYHAAGFLEMDRCEVLLNFLNERK